MNYKLPFAALKILSQSDAQDHVNNEPKKWNVISITSVNGAYYKATGKVVGLDKPNLKNAKDFKSIHFDDIQKELEHLVLCNKWHIGIILDYARKLYDTDEAVIIHCHAGISRSSAITYLILLDYLKDKSPNLIDDALQLLIQIKSWELIIPNRYIIGLGIHMLAKDAGQEMEWLRIFYSHPITKKLYPYLK